MDGFRIAHISKQFANRWLTRRRVLAEGGAGLAAVGLGAAGLSPATAQEATPVTPDADHGPTMLFVQSFESGSIAPKEGADDRYTVTLNHGLGQTVYFSDRPDRIVGATPTGQFLDGLGFPPDNPPNAALVVETAPGETDLAVVELFDPVHDPATATVTYELAVLANWEDSSDLGFAEASIDLAAMAPSFGSAQLFIDDCTDADIKCLNFASASRAVVGTIPNEDHDGFCYSWGAAQCLPCQPWIPKRYDAFEYWGQVCNERFSGCGGKNCEAVNV